MNIYLSKAFTRLARRDELRDGGLKSEDRGQKAGQGGLTNNKRYPARVIGGDAAEDLFKRGLCLPSGTAMTEDDLERVIETILNCRPG